MAKLLLKVELVKHEDQRYPTVGDWYFEDEAIVIRVSDVNNPLYSMLVAIHEIVEVVLCQQHGINQEDVDAFDTAHSLLHDPKYPEPGEDPAAPYFKEHAIATLVERLVARSAGVHWLTYSDAIDLMFPDDSPK